MPRHRFFAPLALGMLLASVSGCDALLPNAPPDEQLLEGPFDDLTGPQLAAHLAGDREFGRLFTVADGLGPIFVPQACGSCHVGDGKGHPLFNLTRFGRMGTAGFDPMREYGGPQVQNRAIHSYIAEVVPSGVTGTARFTAPAVTGLGFLEAVDDTTLLRLEDPNDADGDGISGRVQLVGLSDLIAEVARLELLFEPGNVGRHLEIQGKYIGRFGKKASAINLLHQTDRLSRGHGAHHRSHRRGPRQSAGRQLRRGRRARSRSTVQHGGERGLLLEDAARPSAP